MARTSEPAYIYLMRTIYSKNVYKIGHTGDPKARFSQLRSSDNYRCDEIVLSVWVSSARSCEGAVQKYAKKIGHHHYGEVYEISDYNLDKVIRGMLLMSCLSLDGFHKPSLSPSGVFGLDAYIERLQNIAALSSSDLYLWLSDMLEVIDFRVDRLNDSEFSSYYVDRYPPRGTKVITTYPPLIEAKRQQAIARYESEMAKLKQQQQQLDLHYQDILEDKD